MIDNASTDNSLEVIRSYGERVRIVELTANFGFAGGYNSGLKHINAEVFILLNSDIEVTPEWTAPLIGAMHADKTVGAVVPKIKAHQKTSHFEYAGAAGGYLDKFGYAFCRGRIFDEIEIDQGQYDTKREVAWGSGCALVVRATLFQGLGGFDHSFFAHYEEIDLCWRIRQAGYCIYALPESTVYHLGGGTMGYASPRKMHLNFRNSLFMLYKNLDGWARFKVILARLVLDGVASGVFLLEGKINFIGAVLKAHLVFYKSMGMLSKRKKMEQNLIKDNAIAPPNENGHFSGSIIYRYFIKKQKTFSALNYEEKEN